MAQYTLKIKTYDPGIVSAFERLRKSRKQSAYTHEALKYFLASEQGVRVMDLMVRETPPTHPPVHVGLEQQPTEVPAKREEQADRGNSVQVSIPEDYCESVLGKILE
jgi:hypothetical protein